MNDRITAQRPWLPRAYAHRSFRTVWSGPAPPYTVLHGEFEEGPYREHAMLVFLIGAPIAYRQEVSIDGVPSSHRELQPGTIEAVDREIAERFGPGVERLLGTEELDPDTRATLEHHFARYLEL